MDNQADNNIEATAQFFTFANIRLSPVGYNLGA
jgi:hypothetical protein